MKFKLENTHIYPTIKQTFNAATSSINSFISHCKRWYFCNNVSFSPSPANSHMPDLRYKINITKLQYQGEGQEGLSHKVLNIPCIIATIGNFLQSIRKINSIARQLLVLEFQERFRCTQVQPFNAFVLLLKIVKHGTNGHRASNV